VGYDKECNAKGFSTINILSLFDGMSCLQIALNRLGIKYTNYYASEIDKYAIQVTQHNYPNTIQLGDITKWKEWDLPHIDLIAGGSPCQGFSIAGKRLNFDDPRSKLYFVFEDIVKHYKPDYWLLENVIMLQEHQDIISQRLGIKPIKINSALISAQNRERLYWTNIENEYDLFGFPYCNIYNPNNKYIFLKDILENNDSGYFNKYRISKERQISIKDQNWKNDRPNNINGKCQTLLAGHGIGGTKPKIWCETINDMRSLTPNEFERLQTVPDNQTLVLEDNKQKVSNTQRYKMLGNGWTIDVICHILSHIGEYYG